MRSKSFYLSHCVLLLLISGAVQPQTMPAQEDEFPPVPIESVARYTARKISADLKIDGKLDEESWQQAVRSPDFVDLIQGTPTLHSTRAAVLWDEQYLYVAFWIEEPYVTAKFTERDSPIWQDNDVEIFVAGADAYYEFEINALGTIYEGFFIWEEAYRRSGYDRMSDFDRSDERVTWQPFNGVGLRNHPRGGRYAFLRWDYPGIRAAVDVQGTLNDDRDRDHGWTVEVALPWDGMKALAQADGRRIPPAVGDTWRMDFSRFNQYRASGSEADSSGWSWSHHGVWDSHVPEVFPFIRFADADDR